MEIVIDFSYLQQFQRSTIDFSSAWSPKSDFMLLVNDHDMCVQVTDDMKTMTESPPPAKRSRPVNGSSRRVTFNPNVQERALHPVTDLPKPVTLKEAADIVVRYLDPFYTQGKFATKVSECCVCKKKKKKVGLRLKAECLKFFLYFAGAV